jgi:hypothetical protein
VRPAASAISSPARDELCVVLLDRQRRRRVDHARLLRVLRDAARTLRVEGEVSLVLSGDRRLRALNARYRFPQTAGRRGWATS